MNADENVNRCAIWRAPVEVRPAGTLARLALLSLAIWLLVVLA